MDVNDIKEALSKNYTRIIGNRGGFWVEKPDKKDTGVDLVIKYDIVRTMKNGIRRVFEAPHSCNLQLKSTTEEHIEESDGFIIYDLEAKNYNDLVFSRKYNATPLVLILYVLPSNDVHWVNVLDHTLQLSKLAYWYFPDNEEETTNRRSKRIKIPIQNRLSSTFFEDTIKTWIPTWKSPI